MARGVKGSTPSHGHRARYVAGCRCEPCTSAIRRYETLRRLNATPRRTSIIGTQRRIRALMRLGWRASDVASRLGVDAAVVTLLIRKPGDALVEVRTAKRVAAVFDQLCMTPGPSEITRRRARAKGWASPLAWDDIDHDARPNVDGSEGGPPRADVDAVVRLTRAGRSATEIAVALGVSRRTVVRVRARVKETAA